MWRQQYKHYGSQEEQGDPKSEQSGYYGKHQELRMISQHEHRALEELPASLQFFGYRIHDWLPCILPASIQPGARPCCSKLILICYQPFIRQLQKAVHYKSSVRLERKR